MNVEKRLAVATELLRQTEKALGPVWVGKSLREMRDRENELKRRVSKFVDEEFNEMGISDRQAIYGGQYDEGKDKPRFEDGERESS